MRPADDLATELTRQTDTLLGLGYPTEVATAAAALLEPLRAVLGGEVRSEPSLASFIVVPSGPPVSARIPLLRMGERTGTLSRHFADVDSFGPTVEVPQSAAYAVVGVERGEEFCGVRPAEAAPVIAERGRTMLTLEEGLAFLHAVPEALEKNRCFHTGATRDTDRRVPAIWIADKAPHVGWCWEGNHHTWLGVASASARVAPALERAADSM